MIEEYSKKENKVVIKDEKGSVIASFHGEILSETVYTHRDYSSFDIGKNDKLEFPGETKLEVIEITIKTEMKGERE